VSVEEGEERGGGDRNERATRSHHRNVTPPPPSSDADSLSAETDLRAQHALLRDLPHVTEQQHHRMATLQADVERLSGMLRASKAENEDLRTALETVASGAAVGAGASAGSSGSEYPDAWCRPTVVPSALTPCAGAAIGAGSTLHATTPATAVLLASASRAELLSQLTKLRNQCGEMEVVRAANERQVALLSERVTTLEQSLLEVSVRSHALTSSPHPCISATAQCGYHTPCRWRRGPTRLKTTAPLQAEQRPRCGGSRREGRDPL